MASTGGGGRRAEVSGACASAVRFLQPVVIGVLLGQGGHKYGEIWARGSSANLGLCLAGLVLGGFAAFAWVRSDSAGEAAATAKAKLRLSLFWMACLMNGGLAAIAQLRRGSSRSGANEDALAVNAFLSSSLLGAALPHILASVGRNPDAETLMPCALALLVTEAICGYEALPQVQVVVPAFLFLVGLRGLRAQGAATDEASPGVGAAAASADVAGRSGAPSVGATGVAAAAARPSAAEPAVVTYEPFCPATVMDSRRYSPVFLMRQRRIQPLAAELPPFVSLLERQAESHGRPEKGRGKDRGPAAERRRGGAGGPGSGRGGGERERVAGDDAAEGGAPPWSSSTGPRRSPVSLAEAEVGSDIRWDIIYEEMQRVDADKAAASLSGAPGGGAAAEQGGDDGAELPAPRAPDEADADDLPVEVFAALAEPGEEEEPETGDAACAGDAAGVGAAVDAAGDGDAAEDPPDEAPCGLPLCPPPSGRGAAMEDTPEPERGLANGLTLTAPPSGRGAAMQDALASDDLAFGGLRLSAPPSGRMAAREEDDCSCLMPMPHMAFGDDQAATASAGAAVDMGSTSDAEEAAVRKSRLELCSLIAPPDGSGADYMSASATAFVPTEAVGAPDASAGDSWPASMRADAQAFLPGAFGGIVGAPGGAGPEGAGHSGVEGEAVAAEGEAGYMGMDYTHGPWAGSSDHWDGTWGGEGAEGPSGKKGFDSWGPSFGGEGWDAYGYSGSWEGYGNMGDYHGPVGYEYHGHGGCPYMPHHADAGGWAQGAAADPPSTDDAKGKGTAVDSLMDFDVPDPGEGIASQVAGDRAAGVASLMDSDSEEPPPAASRHADVASLAEPELPDPGCGRASMVRAAMGKALGYGGHPAGASGPGSTLKVSDLDRGMTEEDVVGLFLGTASPVANGVAVVRSGHNGGGGHALVEFVSPSVAAAALETLGGDAAAVTAPSGRRLRVTWAGVSEEVAASRSEAEPRRRRGEGPETDAGRGGAAEEVTWAYVDPKGEVQVGFSSEDMRKWYQMGYFKSGLRVAVVRTKFGRPKAPPMREFYPLAQWFPDMAKCFTYIPRF